MRGIAQMVAGTVRFDVRAAVDRALGRADLYVDGGYLVSDFLAPFGFSWNASLLTGSHALVAKAKEPQSGTGEGKRFKPRILKRSA